MNGYEGVQEEQQVIDEMEEFLISDDELDIASGEENIGTASTKNTEST